MTPETVAQTMLWLLVGKSKENLGNIAGLIRGWSAGEEVEAPQD